MGRFPPEDSPCREIGRRVVEGDHHREEPEVRFQSVVRDACGWYAQVVADALRDLAHRDPFIPTACSRVPAGPSSSARR